MQKRKIVSLACGTLLALSTLTACKKGYEGLSTDVQGTIDIMLWSGDNSYTEDIGHKDIPAEELLSQNVAATYAVAKQFNDIYPEVKINVFAKQGGPHDNDTPWAQELENFKAEHGKYPDIYASTDLVGDVKKGMVADISRFKDDPLYKSFNESIMNIMNYYGKQFALPQFMQPWGVYVNRGLAEDNNLDVPETNWTIDDYTSFIRQGNNDTFFGSMDVPMNFLKTGTETFAKQILNRKEGEDFVNLASEQIFELIDYIPKWADDAVHPQNDLGKVPSELMAANDNWAYNFFKNGHLLTLDGDPWMMGDAANPNPEHWGKVQSEDWDIYPRPSTKFVDNTVGLVLDPMVVFNHAMEDGKPEETESEAAKTKLAYTFASFWAGDSRSWEARAKQEFNDGGNLKTAINDSLPLVTGDEFNKQMDIWYSAPTHQRFKDKDKMPGWHKILELWEKGQFWDVSDKTTPWYYEVDGASQPILFEWENYWNPDLVGARRTDPNFTDAFKAKLQDWNTEFNKRFKEAEQGLKDGLKQFYGMKDEDFKS